MVKPLPDIEHCSTLNGLQKQNFRTVLFFQ